MTARLNIYADVYADNSFVIKAGDDVFARLNLIREKWVVWYYTLHAQKEFMKLKDALSAINNEYISSITEVL